MERKSINISMNNRATKILRSPIPWFGGKGKFVNKLLPCIPSHKIYCEVFGGGASLLFAKFPSQNEIYNDIDGRLINFYRILRDPIKFKKLYKLLQLTPYSREEHNYCRNNYDQENDDIIKAYMFFIMVRQCFSGNINTAWSYAITRSRNGMNGEVSNWLSIIKLLPQIHKRLIRVSIENDDFRKILWRYDTPNTFFYLDPPYVMNTRKSGGYKYEMANNDHQELIEILLDIKGKVLLSGYNSNMYIPLEAAGWIRKDYQTVCHAAGRTRFNKILGKGSATKLQPRTESLWMNYNKQRNLYGSTTAREIYDGENQTT